jgi:hypothetical protein
MSDAGGRKRRKPARQRAQVSPVRSGVGDAILRRLASSAEFRREFLEASRVDRHRVIELEKLVEELEFGLRQWHDLMETGQALAAQTGICIARASIEQAQGREVTPDEVWSVAVEPLQREGLIADRPESRP